MSHFLLPFKEKYKEKYLSAQAITIAVFFSVVALVLTIEFTKGFVQNIITITSIYVVVIIFLLSLGASYRKTIALLFASALFIFFLGLPSLFLENGYEKAGLIWLRGLFSASILILYSTTVTMQEFVQSLRSIFFPNIIVTIILLILRYTPLLYEEGKEIRVSQELRGLDFASWKERIKAFGALLGGTLIRSVKKGGEIYEAMVLRGMENSKIVQRGKVKWPDPIILVILAAVLSLLSGGIINCIMK
ncbi:MAG: energy-coupling factor transporter transmembrane component T family protein [Candidatus Heimdallarchaeaceae archaeon]